MRLLLVLISTILLTGCFSTRLDPKYKGPPLRPVEFESYYNKGTSYLSFKEEELRKTDKYTVKRIKLETEFGPTTVEFYARHKLSDDLIFVFPLLGGKNIIADHFAQYFADAGFDTAIVMRNDDFKSPENFNRLEELLRINTIRDRIAIDFFEREHGKKDFGTFGISRGAINVAMTAGVDARLKYNVMAMGATNLVDVFKTTSQKRMRRYTKTVSEQQGITEEEVYKILDKNLKTDPKYLASYLDARDTLLFLSLFDRTVPIREGFKLRDQIGSPKTIYLAADHYTSILYTQYVSLIPPASPIAIFPYDYVESEALEFYKSKFKRGHRDIRPALLNLLQAPGNLIADILYTPGPKDDGPRKRREPVE